MTTKKHYEVRDLDDGDVIEVIATSLPENLLRLAAQECSLYLVEVPAPFEFSTSDQGEYARLDFIRDVFDERYTTKDEPEETT